MKQLKNILLFICFVLYGNIASADFYDDMEPCRLKAESVAQEYKKKAENQEIKEIEDDDIIRNYCLGKLGQWAYYYEYGNCGNFPDIKSGGPIVSQKRKWEKINCLSDNIETVSSAVEESDELFIKIISSAEGDMNFVNQSIRNGEETVLMLIISKDRCFETDDNGDTVWHTFARKKKLEWSDICASLLEEEVWCKNKDSCDFTDMAQAMYKIKNNSGKTALQETLEWDKNTKLLSAVSELYGKKGGSAACDELAQDIADSNNIDVSKAKSLINKCYK